MRLLVLPRFNTLLCTPGLTQSTTNKCISTSNINNTRNSISTFSMPTQILLHRLPHLHRLQHKHKLPPQPLHPQGRTQPLHHSPHPTLMPPQEPMTLQEATAPLRWATTLHPGITMAPLEATTPRQDMTHLQATGHLEHMILLELTQQRKATPHLHRMSRHPHTGNPCPSVTITLTTRQNPLIDSQSHPPPHTSYTPLLCVFTYCT